MRISDWSSDVCSSDLHGGIHADRGVAEDLAGLVDQLHLLAGVAVGVEVAAVRDHVEGDLHRIDLRLDRLEVEQAGGLAAEFLQRPAPGTRHRLVGGDVDALDAGGRSEEPTSELQSLMPTSYAV